MIHFAVQKEIENAYRFQKGDPLDLRFDPSFLAEKITWLKSKGVNVKEYEAQYPRYEKVFKQSLNRLLDVELILLTCQNPNGLAPLLRFQHLLEKARKLKMPIEKYETALPQLETNLALAKVADAVEGGSWYVRKDVTVDGLIQEVAEKELSAERGFSRSVRGHPISKPRTLRNPTSLSSGWWKREKGRVSARQARTKRPKPKCGWQRKACGFPPGSMTRTKEATPSTGSSGSAKKRTARPDGARTFPP